MRRLSTYLLVALAFAVPAFARVLSYAPYTNRTATPGVHERTTKQFLLMESKSPEEFSLRQLVMYDTRGEEPRVVYPTDGGFAPIVAAALFESKAPIAAPIDPPPALLVVETTNIGGTRVRVSPNAGQTWNDVDTTALNNVVTYNPSLDFGGPWVQGLSNPIRTGNDQYPFVVSTYSNQGVYAISGTGNVKMLFAATPGSSP
ncbi:MAG: hypothetical protein ACLGH0_06905, partial [Thermoanaerobaculia bacterium]